MSRGWNYQIRQVGNSGDVATPVLAAALPPMLYPLLQIRGNKLKEPSKQAEPIRVSGTGIMGKKQAYRSQGFS
jgi:hypothetical protein